MKLISVSLEKDNQARLSWEFADFPLEPGLNEVIIRDFESCESLLTEYLDVAKPNNRNVRIGQFEWEERFSEQAATALLAPTEIENLEKELEQLEGELSKICEEQRDSTRDSSPNLDADVETQDESSSDSQDGSEAPHEEKIRLEKMRSQKYAEVRSVRERLAALREQDSSLSAPRDPSDSRVIKISCYNPLSGQPKVTFIVTTLWKNVNQSLGFILTFPTRSLWGKCGLTETFEITQNTELDWENAKISSWDINATGTCRRGIPFLHYGEREDLRAEQIFTFNAYESKHCARSISLRYSYRPTMFRFETHACRIYAAGKFVGEFKTVPQDSEGACWGREKEIYVVKDVEPCDYITVQDNSDGSRQITLERSRALPVNIRVFYPSSVSEIISLRRGESYTIPPPAK